MKLAVITPPRFDPIVEPSGYHLILAQYLLRDPAYAVQTTMKALQHGFLMLDNGAAEGEPVPLYKLINLAETYRIDEIILPDVLRDSTATISGHLDKKVLQKIPPRNRAIVPQGQDWDEWIHCLDVLDNQLKFRTICLPKHLETLPDGRRKALTILMERRLHLTHDIHLLGCSQAPLTEVLNATAIYANVRGIDTGAPIAYAQHGQLIDTPHPHRSLDWDADADFPLVIENVSLMNKVVKGLAIP